MDDIGIELDWNSIGRADLGHALDALSRIALVMESS